MIATHAVGEVLLYEEWWNVRKQFKLNRATAEANRVTKQLPFESEMSWHTSEKHGVTWLVVCLFVWLVGWLATCQATN
jgi:hypothetical protein